MNANNNNSPLNNSNPIYAVFKDSGVNPSLVALFGTKALVSLVGIVANLDLLFITWKTKKLRKVCNLQIALCAFSIAMQEFSSLITFGVVITGINFITLRICAIAQSVPFFFTLFTTVITFSIGIDRFLSIVFPMWYLGKDTDRRYFLTVALGCSLFSLFAPLVGIHIGMTIPDLPVMCTVIDPVQGDATWITVLQLAINCLTVACYLLLWTLVLCTKSTLLKNKQMKILKSLSVILLLEILGWVSNYSIRISVGAAHMDALPTWYIVNIATISPYLSLTLSPIVLYIFSTEYRRAFLHQLGEMPIMSNGTVPAQIQIRNVGI